MRKKTDSGPKPNVYASICPSRDILALIGEKWVALVIGALNANGVMRFGDLKRYCEGVSQKVLTQTLRKLERNGLVTRTVHSKARPLKVEYRLSKLGQSVAGIVIDLKSWSEANLHEIEENQRAYDKAIEAP